MAGFGFGAFFFNFISTAIVNPRHEEPDPVTGLFPLDVAENVPKMLRILCACWLGLAIVGVLTIFPFVDDKKAKNINNAVNVSNHISDTTEIGRSTMRNDNEDNIFKGNQQPLLSKE